MPEGLTPQDLLTLATLPGGVVLALAWFFRAEIKLWLKAKGTTARDLAAMSRRLDDHIAAEEAYWTRSEQRIGRLEDSHQGVEARLLGIVAAVEGQSTSMQAQMSAQGEKIAWLAQSVDRQSTALHDLTQALLDHFAHARRSE